MLIAFSMEELSGAIDSEGDYFGVSWRHESILYRQNFGELIFWEGCIGANRIHYVQEHLSNIANLACGGLLLSALCLDCLANLSCHALGDRADPKFIVLLINMLKVLALQYQDTTVRSVSSKHPSHFGEAEVKIWEDKASIRCNISSSYVENAPQDHSHIVCELTELYHRLTTLIRSGARKYSSNRRNISFIEERGGEVASLIRKIIEPWERFMSIQPPLRESNNCMFFQLSAAAFIRNAQTFRWKQEHDPAEVTTLTYDFVPKLRIVCTSRSSSQKPKASNKFSVIVTHDLSHHVTAGVLESFEMMSAFHVNGFVSDGNWCGNWEDCLRCREMIINDVWENVDQKLDGWQQIYLLACLKTRFRHMWDIRSEGGDSDTNSDTEF